MPRHRSLRWRLQAWHALILFLVVAGFGTLLYLESRRAKLDEIDAELLAGARVLEGVLRATPPGLGINPDRIPDNRRTRPRRPRGDEPASKKDFRPPPYDFPPPPPPPPQEFDGPHPRFEEIPPPRRRASALNDAFDLPHSLMDRYGEGDEAPYFVIRNRQNQVVRSSVESSDVPPDSLAGVYGEIHARNRGRNRELSLLGPDHSTITVGRPIGREIGGLRRMGLRIALSGLIVFVSGLVGGWWLSSRAVRPIKSMSETVESITATSLSRRVDLNNVDTELAELGGILNGMLDRLELAFERQVRFTADASHEVRTPLTVILTKVELALARDRTPAEYRDALQATDRAARRMKSLVDGLLALARADSGKMPTPDQNVNLAKLVDETTSALRPLALRHGVTIGLDLRPVTLHGADPDRLTQVVTNLLTNAIRYNREGGDVSVVVKQEGSEAIISIADTGVGIPEADLPRLFERFYRVDKARPRDSGGSGLGLAIVKSIIESHQGTIDVSSRLGEGSRFLVRLPIHDAIDTDFA